MSDREKSLFQGDCVEIGEDGKPVLHEEGLAVICAEVERYFFAKYTNGYGKMKDNKAWTKK